MSKHSSTVIVQLGADDIQQFQAMITMFGDVFDQVSTYCDHRPSRAYLEALLASQTFIAIAALQDGTVVGGLAAYELKKFEQERSEIYIYDLAVAASHRRQGIATAMIQKLRQIGWARGAYVIFVQADYQDPPAIALYETLGVREEVLHFDIAVSPPDSNL